MSGTGLSAAGLVGGYSPMGGLQNPLTGSKSRENTKTDQSKDAYSFNAKKGKYGGMNKVLFYPLENSETAATRPQIQFSCVHVNYEGEAGEGKTAVRTRQSCYFPCPANIAFGDAANLSSIDLGVMGAGAALADYGGGSGTGVSLFLETIGDAIGKTLSGGLNSATGGSVDKALAIKKAVANPFTNTTFQGNNVRSFTFNFKMIATSRAEAAMIKSINDFFRINMYGGDASDIDFENEAGAQAAADSGLIDTYLAYPPVWEIDFVTEVPGTYKMPMNPYLPKIFSCYLGGFNSTFNTTSAAWFSDGAPLEVDISLTFQETRALNRKDIANLQSLEGDYLMGDEESNMIKRGIGVGGKAIGVPVGSNQGKLNTDVEIPEVNEDGTTTNSSESN
jgi:hypothetical protein